MLVIACINMALDIAVLGVVLKLAVEWGALKQKVQDIDEKGCAQLRCRTNTPDR